MTDALKRLGSWRVPIEAYWKAYDHSVPFDRIFDVKIGGHGYVALAWKVDDDSVEFADLASPDGGRTWDMQNDTCGPYKLSAWKRARVVLDCDWLDIEEENE